MFTTIAQPTDVSPAAAALETIRGLADDSAMTAQLSSHLSSPVAALAKTVLQDLDLAAVINDFATRMLDGELTAVAESELRRACLALLVAMEDC